MKSNPMIQSYSNGKLATLKQVGNEKFSILSGKYGINQTNSTPPPMLSTLDLDDVST